MTPVLEDEFSFWLLNDIIPVFREFLRLYFCGSLRSPCFFVVVFSSAKNGFDVVVWSDSHGLYISSLNKKKNKHMSNLYTPRSQFHEFFLHPHFSSLRRTMNNASVPTLLATNCTLRWDIGHIIYLPAFNFGIWTHPPNKVADLSQLHFLKQSTKDGTYPPDLNIGDKLQGLALWWNGPNLFHPKHQPGVIFLI